MERQDNQHILGKEFIEKQYGIAMNANFEAKGRLARTFLNEGSVSSPDIFGYLSTVLRLDIAKIHAMPENYDLARADMTLQHYQRLLRACNERTMTPALKKLLEKQVTYARNQIGVKEDFTRPEEAGDLNNLPQVLSQVASDASGESITLLSALTQGLRLFPEDTLEEGDTQLMRHGHISEFEQQLRNENPLVYTEKDEENDYYKLLRKVKRLRLLGAKGKTLLALKKKWEDKSHWGIFYSGKVPARWQSELRIARDMQEAGRQGVRFSPEYIAAGLEHPGNQAAQAVAVNQPLTLYSLAYYIQKTDSEPKGFFHRFMPSRRTGSVESVIRIQKERFHMSAEDIQDAQKLAVGQRNYKNSLRSSD